MYRYMDHVHPIFYRNITLFKGEKPRRCCASSGLRVFELQTPAGSGGIREPAGNLPPLYGVFLKWGLSP